MNRSMWLVALCVVVIALAHTVHSAGMNYQAVDVDFQDEYEVPLEYDDDVNLDSVLFISEAQQYYIQTNKIVFRPELVEYSKVQVVFDHFLWNKLSLEDNRQSIVNLTAQDGQGIAVLELVSVFDEYHSKEPLSVYQGPYLYIPPDTFHDPYQVQTVFADIIIEDDPWSNVKVLMEWFRDNVTFDAYSENSLADMVLDACVGNSLGIADLFVTLSRMLGIPAKYVVGAKHINGFFYWDVWVEVWVDNMWVAVEPAQGELYPNALMIKLGEAYSPAGVLNRLGLIWRGIRHIEIFDYIKEIIRGSSGTKLISGISRGRYVNADLGFELKFDESAWTVRNRKTDGFDTLFFTNLHDPNVMIRIEFIDMNMGIGVEELHYWILERYVDSMTNLKEVVHIGEVQFCNKLEGRQTHLILEDENDSRGVLTTVLASGRFFILFLIEEDASSLKYEKDINDIICSLILY